MCDVIQLQQLTRFVLGVGISNCCLFRRILWTARKLHKASEAVSLVSNPSFSNVLIKICCAASSCVGITAARTDVKLVTYRVYFTGRVLFTGALYGSFIRAIYSELLYSFCLYMRPVACLVDYY